MSRSPPGALRSLPAGGSRGSPHPSPKFQGSHPALGFGQLWDVLWVPSCPTLWRSRSARMFCFRLIGIPSYPNESGDPVPPWGSHPPWGAGGVRVSHPSPKFWGSHLSGGGPRGPILPQRGGLGSHPSRGGRESPPAPRAEGIPSSPRDREIPTLPGGGSGGPFLARSPRSPARPAHSLWPRGCGRVGETGRIAWLCPGPSPRALRGDSSRHPDAGHAGGALRRPRHFLRGDSSPARRGVGRGRGVRATPQPVPTSRVPRWGSYRGGPASLPPPQVR